MPGLWAGEDRARKRKIYGINKQIVLIMHSHALQCVWAIEQTKIFERDTHYVAKKKKKLKIDK